MTRRLSVPASGLLAVGMAALLASGGYGAEVAVENYSNSDIHVSFAFNRGRTVSDGWTTIRPNEKKVFHNDTQDEMYLRVQNADGNEITFGPRFRKFLYFPASNERFIVQNEPDDSNVRTFRWGPQLDHRTNRTRGQTLPSGFGRRRYFSVGSGNDRLEVTP
jgi:hypothetical protein